MLSDITVYIHGCPSCGLNGVHISKVKKYAKESGIHIEIKNSKYNENDRIEHGVRLRMAGYSMDSYQPIVVQGEKVARLREWSS